MRLAATLLFLTTLASFGGARALAETGMPMQDSEQRDGAAQAAVVGKVLDSRNVRMSSPTAHEHKLYKVRTAQGNTLIVDVGPGPHLDLGQGDRVMAIGSKARINGKPVLFARYYGEARQAGRDAADAAALRQTSADPRH